MLRKRTGSTNLMDDIVSPDVNSLHVLSQTKLYMKFVKIFCG